MELLLLTFFTAFVVVLFSTPSLIKVAILKRLFDEPTEERKLHKRVIPTIGGVIIFAGTFFSFVLWFPSDSLLNIDVGNSSYLKNALALEVTKSALNDFKYILATVLVLFFVGVKDDIIGTSPIKRLAAHVIVALIIVLMADIRVKSMQGIFGVYEIPYWSSIFISLFATIVIINAFNFIDGIDGLAAGIGCIAATIFGIWFYMANDIVMSLLSFALSGSLFAFLFFNFSPAAIFMGDSGSTTIGLMLSVLALKAIETPNAEVSNTIISEVQRPIFVMAVLSYPLIDTLRIFVYRTVKGVSPFEADRNHIHHALLNTGMNHPSVTLTLYAANLFVIALAVAFRGLSPTESFVVVFLIAAALAQLPFFFKKKMPVRENPKNGSNGNGHSKVSEEARKKLFHEDEF
ncbi:MAG: undecaprenyl/decaprenyl-phosphate alpha-N-acetylglucosaminyl 1-phosphate transferase [Bacteroidetes bacterium]|nr:MAG: undecaprenyl/decaprenyl-phosphate alpha-N-acetylglucosaminyl 1-phosphate transferase [Bacteroidota bacterium]